MICMLVICYLKLTQHSKLQCIYITHTSTSKFPWTFNIQYFLPVWCRSFRTGNTTRATPDGNEIIIISCHGLFCVFCCDFTYYLLLVKIKVGMVNSICVLLCSEDIAMSRYLNCVVIKVRIVNSYRCFCLLWVDIWTVVVEVGLTTNYMVFCFLWDDIVLCGGSGWRPIKISGTRSQKCSSEVISLTGWSFI